MIDDTASEKPLEPDSDRLWLKGGGEKVSVGPVENKKRALDIVEALRVRYAKSGNTRPANSETDK